MEKANPNVAVIPATRRSVQNGGQLKKQTNIRVAAYCRVSTGDESQQTSYTNQKAFYSGLIQGREGWKFAGIYADEAISGTSRIHRVEFNRMMEDAKAGRLDYIVTKSISRFARNTVDTLNCVRELRQQNPPVGIYFEKENIDTLDATGELLLTILSALAQDESRSISDNIRWTFQKNFQAGIPQINLKRMLGYDKGEDGAWVINPDQAKIVRHIFERYVLGHSANGIAKELNALGQYTVNGKRWTSGAVLSVLRNEKHVGDLEMQKTITRDFLSHRSVKNHGEAPRYYVENHHVGIIDRLTWDKVQIMLGEKHHASDGSEKTRNPRGPKGSPFRNLRCGAIRPNGKECGSGFFRITYSNAAAGYTDERSLAASGEGDERYLEKYTYAHPVWRCKEKYGKKTGADGESCPSEVLHECALEQSFMETLYFLKRDYLRNGENSEICRRFRAAYDRVYLRMRSGSISIQRLEYLNDQTRGLEKELRETIARQAAAMLETVLEQNPDLIGALEEGTITTEDIEINIRNRLTNPDTTPGFFHVEPEEDGEATIYAELVRDLRQRLEEVRREQHMLEAEQGIINSMKNNYSFFLKCLEKLPEKNHAGLPLQIYGLDVDENALQALRSKVNGKKRRPLSSAAMEPAPEDIAAAPDYLPFERCIYAAFIERGIVNGEHITYHTNFGVKFTCSGNRRTLGSFLGFRRCLENGALELLTTPYQVNGKRIQYRRYPGKNVPAGRNRPRNTGS